MADAVVISNALPDDLVLEILARLSVKSLMRFTCVCKTWCSVISDRRFCNNFHQMRSSVLICEKSKKFSTVTLESLLARENRAPTLLSLPWQPELDDQNQFLGSCNGLVCVDHKSKSSPDKSDLMLWNPSTRKFRRLPRPRCYGVEDEFFTYVWFGYDQSVNDYKLIWVNCCYPFNVDKATGFDVFTLKANTWRRKVLQPLDHPIAKLGDHKSDTKSIGVFSNGAIHWGVYYVVPSEGFMARILALDLATEKFRRIRFPYVPLGYDTWVGSLLGECLCLCTSWDNHPKVGDGCGGMTLWVMKEYGVESSWTKMKFIPNMFIRSYFGLLRFYPIRFSEEEGKESVTILDDGRSEQMSEGIRFEETLFCAPRIGNGPNGSPHQDVEKCPNKLVLPIKESLVSLTASD